MMEHKSKLAAFSCQASKTTQRPLCFYFALLHKYEWKKPHWQRALCVMDERTRHSCAQPPLFTEASFLKALLMLPWQGTHRGNTQSEHAPLHGVYTTCTNHSLILCCWVLVLKKKNPKEKKKRKVLFSHWANKAEGKRVKQIRSAHRRALKQCVSVDTLQLFVIKWKTKENPLFGCESTFTADTR